MKRLDEAFAAIHREDFLPQGQVRFAGLDQALPIGYGQTNSQPTTVRHQLAHLDVRPGQRVLDVGCGSGWTTALLGHLVGPTGSVTGVELVQELVTLGRSHLARVDLPWVRIEPAAPDVLGDPDRAPYDRILVSAEAPALPHELVDQLGPSGVMVIPVAGRLIVVRRPADPGAAPEVTRHGRYRFVPLVLPGDDAG